MAHTGGFGPASNYQDQLIAGSQDHLPAKLQNGPRPIQRKPIKGPQSSPSLSNRSSPYQSPLSTTQTTPFFPPQRTNTRPMNNWETFSISTKTLDLSSGFTYDDRLHDLGVSRDLWFQFTSEIIRTSKLTFKEDYAAWTAGVTTGTLSLPFLLPFGPMVGYWAGKRVHRQTVASKVQEKLVGEGDIRSILQTYNSMHFHEKGFQVWLELPDVLEEKKKQKFKIMIIPIDETSTPAAPIAYISGTEGYEIPASSELEDSEIDPVKELEDVQVHPDKELEAGETPSSGTGRSIPPPYLTETKIGEIKHEMPISSASPSRPPPVRPPPPAPAGAVELP